MPRGRRPSLPAPPPASRKSAPLQTSSQAARTPALTVSFSSSFFFFSLGRRGVAWRAVADWARAGNAIRCEAQHGGHAVHMREPGAEQVYQLFGVECDLFSSGSDSGRYSFALSTRLRDAACNTFGAATATVATRSPPLSHFDSSVVTSSTTAVTDSSHMTTNAPTDTSLAIAATESLITSSVNNLTSSIALAGPTSSTTASPTTVVGATSPAKQSNAPVAAGAKPSRTTVLALAASLGGSVSLAIDLLGLCWWRRIRRKRHNVVPTDPRLRVTSVFSNEPRQGRDEHRRRYGSAFRDSGSPEMEQGFLDRNDRPVTRTGLAPEDATLPTGRHGCKLVHRASTSRVRSVASDQEISTVATQGGSEPLPAGLAGAEGTERHPWPRVPVAAGAPAPTTAVEVHPDSSEYTAPTYTSEEPILPWTRNAPPRLQWGEDLARAALGASDEPPPPYVCEP
ncbi:hypothetical protein ONZ51_g11181 [Trametes cubensis]|uniref:Uncharacterized protein n=1 Tax=Trametes cubensis TaxID=1111947 RepID=A0AAD7TJQ5_9APHY|nr:hypothetical protein ONZ51_g11181 [Trametes cubensis]